MSCISVIISRLGQQLKVFVHHKKLKVVVSHNEHLMLNVTSKKKCVVKITPNIRPTLNVSLVCTTTFFDTELEVWWTDNWKILWDNNEKMLWHKD